MPDEELQELNEDDLFNDAVSDEPAETPIKEAVETEAEAKTEQPRDDAGRFAKPDEPEKPASEAENPDDKIPVWRREEMAEARRNAENEARTAREQLAAERFQREELQRRLSALEKPEAKAEKPDPLLDPDGYEKYLESRFEEKLLNDRREFSLASAHKTYKAEFEEAYAAAQQNLDPALKARMQQSRDPGETLIQWHRETKTMREVGTDPTAWLEKKLEERLKDPAFLAKAVELARGVAQPQQSNGRPRVDLPPSLNGASRSTLRSSDNNDLSEHELFEQTTNG